MRRVLDVVLPMVVGALLAFAVWQGFLNQQQGQAICTLRHDLENRVAQSERFLEQHPKGAFGFSAAQIRKGIQDQQRTITALSSVSC